SKYSPRLELRSWLPLSKTLRGTCPNRRLPPALRRHSRNRVHHRADLRSHRLRPTTRHPPRRPPTAPRRTRCPRPARSKCHRPNRLLARPPFWLPGRSAGAGVCPPRLQSAAVLSSHRPTKREADECPAPSTRNAV